MFVPRSALGTLCFLITSLVISPSNAASNSTCSSFTLDGVDGAVVTGRTFYQAGDSVTATNLYQSVSTVDLPAFCRVELVITTNTTANSSALAEVWLPEEWNGRILTIGNGGYSGGGKHSIRTYLL